MKLAVRSACNLQRLNSLAVPATAETLVELTDRQQLPELLSRLKSCRRSPLVMGEGSNLVLGERLSKPVILCRLKGRRLIEETAEQVVIEAAAGENWHDLVVWCLNRCWYGLENLALIPGAVGAAPVQNIGAYGVELSQFVESVEFLDFQTGETRWLARAECDFRYRQSIFKTALIDRGMILAVRLRLNRKPAVVVEYPALKQELAGIVSPTPRQLFDAVVSIRRRRLPDPAVTPNVGSFFHNPVVAASTFRQLKERYPDIPGWDQTDDRVKIPAAWLIEAQGWKGKEFRGVRVSPDHALVILNPGRRPASDVLALAEAIKKSVNEAFAIKLTIEPRVLTD